MDDGDANDQATSCAAMTDWFGEGEGVEIDAGGVRFAIRFIGRKGRRGRIRVEAPPGAQFRTTAPQPSSPTKLS
jgi:hypothetical protein